MRSVPQRWFKNLESERRGRCISQTNTMKTISNSPETFESTYALIMRLEEKQRSRFEILVYTILIAATTFAVAQFAVTMMPLSLAHVSTTVPAAAQDGV